MRINGRTIVADNRNTLLCFWEPGYEDLDPNDEAVPATHRVDVDDLLAKAEEFYHLNIDELKFAERGVGKSKLDDHKMMIMLHYTTEWMAYGGGYDDVIGALWISPSTCQPVGSTIAHEIGHSFQYQVRCDLGAAHGFRYGFGGDGGNGFWEQTAQWQAMQSYPNEVFDSNHFSVYSENYHRHQFHEWYRYANYFIHYYWADKHGVDIVGRIWRESTSPEDPLQGYKRITGISDEQLNAELYEMAAKFATWDIAALRDRGSDYIGGHTYGFDVQQDGALKVAYDHCPGTGGYNVVPLDMPEAGTTVTIDFEGLTNDAQFNPIAQASRAGWRYGYVALLHSGERVYTTMMTSPQGTASYTVPANCARLFFVVTGAPSSYAPHPWDENEQNDEQWPYAIKITGTHVTGYVTFEEGQQPEDITFNYEVELPVDAESYSGKTITMDQSALARAFVLQPSTISEKIGESIHFFGIEPDGILNATTTANGYGHWFAATGAVVSWGENARVFSEFNADAFTFFVGQYPASTQVGDQFTVRQALVYTDASGTSVQATFVFNIKMI